MTDEEKLELIKKAIKSYPDFPVKGVLFQDIFSVLANPPIFGLLKELLIKRVRELQPPVECVVALDARGFLFGPIIALELNIPFVPIRKRGKLAGNVRSYKYDLEYGQDIVEIQEDSIRTGQQVLIVDDLLATGGTMGAAENLINQLGGCVSKCLVIIELVDLKGRDRLTSDVVSLIQL